MLKREKLKDQIVAVVRRSGVAIRTQKIEARVVVPDSVLVTDLLNELVAEGRLVRRFTLLNNGETDHLYNIRMVS